MDRFSFKIVLHRHAFNVREELALWVAQGKKFTSVGRSSIARHYRIQGRGGGLPRVRKATGLPTNPIVLPMRRCWLTLSLEYTYRFVAALSILPLYNASTVGGFATFCCHFPLRCMLLGKMDNRKAMYHSHSGVRTHRIQRVNLMWKRLWWPEAKHYVRLRLSAKGLKTIKKYGLQRAADKFKVNLKDKRLFAGYSHR